MKKLKTNKKNKLIIFPFLIIAIFIISISSLYFYKINKAYITVGNEKINEAEYQYFYQLSISKFKTQYSDYLNYLEVDFEKDLSTQYFGAEKISWEEYFNNQADTMIYEILSLVADSKKNDFKCDVSEDVNAMMSSLEEYALTQNISLDEYIKIIYNKNITEKMLRNCLEKYFISNEYLLSFNNNITEKDYENYYNNNKDSLDSVTYYSITIKESTKELCEEKSKEIISKSSDLDNFKLNAIEYQQDEGYNIVTGITNCDALFSDWLFNSENNSIKYFYDESNKQGYILYKEKREKDMSFTKNIRILKINIPEDCSDDTTYLDKIYSIEDEFKKTGKTENDFIKLVNKYSENEDASIVDGLMNNVTYSDVSLIIGSWLFSENLEPGETTIIRTDTDFSYIYYIGEGISTSKQLSKAGIYKERQQEIISKAKNNYTFKKG